MTTVVWQPTPTALPDGNLVPSAVQRMGSTTCTYQMGKQANDQAAALGLFAVTAAIAALPATAESMLGLGNVLTDAKGRCWLIRSEATIPEWDDVSICSIWLVTLIDANNLPDGVTL